MTQIDFYVHVANKLQTLCTLAAKALARDVRMMVLTPDAETTEQVDRMLWSQPSIGFLPHCRAHHRLAPLTPIIVDHLADPVVHEQLLVNLCPDSPAVFSRFERLIEIVSLDEADRTLARARFRFYRDRGYEIRTHDLAG
ncbi:MAG TPA: DNA polymerase III subunit chi [Burkholderiales bacterium]|nr:DNA polymerase III subunit chi [Burkholderiales bacterium]